MPKNKDDERSKGTEDEVLERFQTLTTRMIAAFGPTPTRGELSIKVGDVEAHLVLERTAAGAGAATTSTDGGAIPLWNKPGHSLVARIAEKVLERRAPAVLSALQQVLDNDPNSRNSFAIAARWPDDNKSDREFHRTTGFWHYVDLEWREGSSASAVPQIPEGAHAITKLKEFCQKLMAQEGEEQTDTLCWILHLTGDLHQPLHCISRVNGRYPKGDRGGNDFKLDYKPNNLHSFWDDILLREGRNGVTNDELDDMATELMEEHREDAFSAAELGQLDPEEWAKAGYKLAVENAYTGVPEKGRPSKKYVDNAKKICRRQATLGGYRLAKLLKSVVEESDSR